MSRGQPFLSVRQWFSQYCETENGLLENRLCASAVKQHHLINKWVAIWQNQQSDCAPSEDSDQPGHPPSLTRVFAVCMKKAWVLSYPLSAQRSLWSDWADAQADLSLRWAHTHVVGFVMSWLKYVPLDKNRLLFSVTVAPTSSRSQHLNLQRLR